MWETEKWYLSRAAQHEVEYTNQADPVIQGRYQPGGMAAEGLVGVCPAAAVRVKQVRYYPNQCQQGQAWGWGSGRRAGVPVSVAACRACVGIGIGASGVSCM